MCFQKGNRGCVQGERNQKKSSAWRSSSVRCTPTCVCVCVCVMTGSFLIQLSLIRAKKVHQRRWLASALGAVTHRFSFCLFFFVFFFEFSLIRFDCDFFFVCVSNFCRPPTNEKTRHLFGIGRLLRTVNEDDSPVSLILLLSYSLTLSLSLSLSHFAGVDFFGGKRRFV